MSSDPRSRDAINEIYDRGCDLVEAAMAIRRAASAFDVAPALPALLGCIECAVDELADASARLSDMPFEGRSDGIASSEVVRKRVGSDDAGAQALVGLENALQDARDAADAARAFAARVRIVAAGFDPRGSSES
jgi:hypothetical protein